MKAIRIFVAIAFSAAVFAQSGTRIMGGSASRNNIGFSYETRLEPASPPLTGFGGGGVTTGDSATHRYLTDPSQHRYFGYDLLIEPLPEANTYRVTFRPLSVDAEKLRLRDPASWTMLPLPVYPAPQTVHAGDTIALDLFTNAATGQKIVDYIRINDKSREFRAVPGAARDFSVADAELRLKEPHVSVNGKPLAETASFTGGVTGAAVWFYIPDRGRYVISLMPHPELGFQKSGEVRGNSLTLTAGGDTITLDCNGAIASGYTPYNLYVLYEPGWRPKDANARNSFLMTSSDSVQALLHP